MTCAGAPTPAKYKLVGTNNAIVTISSPGFNLTGPATLAFTPNAPAHRQPRRYRQHDRRRSSAIGGSITLASTTPDGVYTGNFRSPPTINKI